MPAAARALLPLACAGILSACSAGRTIVAEEAILERQIAALEQLVERAEAGELFPEGDVLVSIDEEWTRSALALELPREEILGESYRVRVETADVRFRDGLGLVRVDGRVSPLGDRNQRVFADLSVWGSFDVVDLDRESGVLLGRVRPLAFEVREVALLVTNPLGRQLVEELGRERIEAFTALGLSVEIPVRLQQTLELPGLGPEGPVEFEGASLPLSLGVSSVTALDGRLWISVASRLIEAAPTPAAAAGAR
jgi:hypothetical protein